MKHFERYSSFLQSCIAWWLQKTDSQGYSLDGAIDRI